MQPIVVIARYIVKTYYMKRLIYILTFFFLISGYTVKAQQILGGDITWTCLISGPNNGKFVFQLTLFNQCDSGALPLINQSIKAYDGPISSIPLSFVKEENISLSCYDTALVINCNRKGSGAVSMGIYKSVPVTLSGIPIGSGWKFTWTNCCRPDGTNINGNGNGYTLRSIMYPFKNKNTNTCYDNSPQFSAPPLSRVCNGYSAIVNHHAYDPDPDLISQYFAEPWDNTTKWPGSALKFDSGYNYSNPFPNPIHHTKNVSAVLYNPSGDILFTSEIVNKIEHTVKISSYRDNILISEVYRDLMVQLDSCPPTNSLPPLANVPPQVVFKDSLNAAAPLAYPYVDTIVAGDSVEFSINTTDIQFLPGFIGQTITTEAYGSQFGAGFTDILNGCNQPPCAVMDTSSNFDSANKHWKNTFGTETSFKWVTDSSHGISGGKIFNFHFITYDDWGPMPGHNEHTYSVVVHEKPPNLIEGIVFDDVNGNGTQDMGESGWPNILVRQLPSHFYYTTNNSGEYSLGAYQGSHVISISLLNFPKYHILTAPSSGKHTVVASGSNNIYSGNDFGMQIIPNVIDIEIDIQRVGNTRPGNSMAYFLSYKNTGTATISGSMELSIDSSLLTYNTSSQTPSINGNVYTWSYSNLPPNSSGLVKAYFKIDTSATIGDTLFAKVKISPITGDTLVFNNTDSIANFIGNSYDPNNKESFPAEFIYVEDIRRSRFIEYTVNFQNTGNASAINVKIEDWIQDKLNIESFEFIGSSHKVSYEIRGQKLTWFFNNIMLPDSTSDFLGSMGFVKFRMKAHAGLPVGDTVFNSVDIFFDFNEPIYAQVKIGIVNDVIDGFSKHNVYSNKDPVLVYPNPSNSVFTVDINSGFRESAEYYLYSISGNKIDQGIIELDDAGIGRFQIDLSSAPRGIYFIQLSGEHLSSVKKLMLQ